MDASLQACCKICQWLNRMMRRLKRLFGAKELEVQKVKGMLPVETLKSKLKASGYRVVIKPVRSYETGEDVITNWKVVAIKNEKTYHLENKDLNTVLHNLAVMLGLVPK